MKNTYWKRFKRWLARVLFLSIRGLTRGLPYGVYRILAGMFFFIAILAVLPKRSLAMKNIRTAFGKEKTLKQMKALLRKYLRNVGRGMIDFIYLVYHPDIVKDKIEIENKEHLDQALEQGHGAILTSAHFGSFLLMYWRLVLEGYNVNVIMRRTHDERFDDYISEMLGITGVKAIYDLPARACVSDSLKALRKNEILFILLDQNYGSAGRVFVDFFGQKAATATGPIVFSLRTNAPILPVFCMNAEGDLRHKLIFEPPLQLVEEATEEETIQTNVQIITNKIESYIRAYPHEWGGWIHKRWKSRPHYEQDIIDQLKGHKTVDISA